jgi:hypothetical protein
MENRNLNFKGFEFFLKWIDKELKPFAVDTLKKERGHQPVVLSIASDGIEVMNLNEILEKIDGESDANLRASGKDLMAKLMHSFVKSRKSFAYVFISECWYVRVPKDAGDSDIESGEVRHRDDKEEALSLVWEFNHGTTKKVGNTIIPYYRHDNTIIPLKEMSSISNGSDLGGRFTGILV